MLRLLSLALSLIVMAAPALASGLPTPADNVLRIPGALPSLPPTSGDAATDPDEMVRKAMEAKLTGNIVGTEDLLAAAIMIYNGRIASNPKDVDALNGRALARLETDDPGGKNDAYTAIELLTTAINTTPPDGTLYHKRARAYRTLQQFDLAVADYNRAIALRPDQTSWAFDLRAVNLERRVKEVNEAESMIGNQ